MKLTNKQIGHILLIPVYIIIVGLIMRISINFAIAIASTPINEIFVWVLTIIIVIMTIYGIHYLDKE